MKIRNEYLVSVATKLVFVGLSFINSILINRYLGPSLKGEYAYIMNIINIITIIIGFNITSSLPYLTKKYGEKIQQKIINIIYVQLFVYIVIGFFLTIVFNASISIYVIVISILIQFSNQLDFISILLNINKRNIIVLITSLIYTSLLIIVFIVTKQSISVIFCTLIFNNIVKSIVFIRYNRLSPKFSYCASISTKEILQVSFFPTITALLTTFNYNIDVIILKSFVTNNQIGIYSVGVTLAAMLWVIPDAFKEVLFNKTARDDSVNQIVMSIKFNFYISLLVIIGFIFFGEKFILVFYGKEYSNSFGVTVILFIGTIPMIFFKIINALYLAIGKQNFSFKVLVIVVIVNITLNYVIIPIYGIIGAALASVASYFICGLIMLISFKSMYSIRIITFFIIRKKEIDSLMKFFKLNLNI